MRITARFGLVAVMLLALVGSAWSASELKTDFGDSKLNAAYIKGDYRAKTDYFILVQDASWSMFWKDKFSEGRNLANQINYAMPKMQLKSGIYTFGESRMLFGKSVRKVWGIDAYTRSDFENGLRSIAQVGFGGSKAYKALNVVVEDLKNQAPRRVAVLVISDGETINEAQAINAVRTLKQDLGDKFCLYTAQIGDSAAGQDFLETLVKEAGCGKCVKASELDQAGTDALVAQMLLQKGVKKAPKDSDGDGVIDELDLCPGTPKGTVVDANGCPIKPKNVEVTEDATWVVTDNVLFDFGKSELKLSAEPVLNEIAKVMSDNAALKLKITGHTDNIGSASLNDALSLKRAQAVSASLAAKGVAADRLSVEGLGFAKPAADNATAEGRAKNRRVEFTPYK